VTQRPGDRRRRLQTLPAARAASYAALSIRLGYELPGAKTVVEEIADNKPPSYRALEAADEACKAGSLDVSAVEGLIPALLAKHLAAVHQQATGGHPKAADKL
jgi:hypothetical protein